MDSTSSTSRSTSLAPTPSPVAIQYPEAPDEFNHDHVTYIKRSRLANKGSKGKSHVWKFGEAYVRSSDKKEVKHSHSQVSLSFDAWTSPNTYSILGVIAMWIDKNGNKRSDVLGIRRMYGEEGGENIGSIVLGLLDEYEISGDQLGYFMLDNHPSNDAAVEYILKEHCPFLT